MPSFPFCGIEGVFVCVVLVVVLVILIEDENEGRERERFDSALVSQPKPFCESFFAEQN